MGQFGIINYKNKERKGREKGGKQLEERKQEQMRKR
jgi:hypothetical protein